MLHMHSTPDTHLVCLAVWQFLACQQVLVLLIVDLQHAGLHGKAPALLAQEATALKHLQGSRRSNRVKLSHKYLKARRDAYNRTTGTDCQQDVHAGQKQISRVAALRWQHVVGKRRLYLCHGPGDDAPVVRVAKHGVCLATACLAIGKDADLHTTATTKLDGCNLTHFSLQSPPCRQL